MRVHPSRKKRPYGAVFVREVIFYLCVVSILLLFVTPHLRTLAIPNNHIFHAEKIERGSRRLKIKREASISELIAELESQLDSIVAHPDKSSALLPRRTERQMLKAGTVTENFDLAPIKNNLREIGQRLKPVSRQIGIDLGVLYEPFNGESTDIGSLRNRTERIKVLQALNREMVERLLDKSKAPILKTWYETGSVILRILVVNPSQTESQTVPVKIYLPKEVSPKDILDLGDLELDYDAEKGMYFAHNNVDLEPGQSIIKMVKMEDIWVFPENQLAEYIHQAKEIASRLENSAYTEEAKAFVLAVESKVQEILERQKITASNAGEHIRAYREGSLLIGSIKRDLSELGGYEEKASEEENQEKSASTPEVEKNLENREEISFQEQETIAEESE